MPELLSVCFLWHFHQPQYQDLTSGTALLPWTRLHCARNYAMMLELLEEQPSVHVTINITPVLATQLAAYGQVELATSPFAHPIIPLLIDTDVARSVQDTPFPQPGFHHPEDAFMQIELGKKTVEDLLHQRVRGCWPSEGSVSQDAVAEIARAGFSWTATDEEILLRELPGEPRLVLYHPYRAQTRAAYSAL